METGELLVGREENKVREEGCLIVRTGQCGRLLAVLNKIKKRNSVCLVPSP